MPEMKRLYVKVEYGDKEITAMIHPYLISLEYSDDIEGGSADKIRVTLADSLMLFQGPLYPIKGAALYFEFGYGPDDAFKSGKGYRIDSIEISGSSDSGGAGASGSGAPARGGGTVAWTASANIPSGDIHTRRSKPWINTTLKAIAEEISAKHGLTLEYNAEAVSLSRLDQVDKSDIQLLKTLAGKYGLQFSLKAGKDKTTMVLSDIKTARAQKPIYRILRSDCVSYKFTDYADLHTKGRYARWFDPVTKKLVECDVLKAAVKAKDGLTESTMDTLDGQGQQDREIVREAMQIYANKPTKDMHRTAELTLPGNPILLAGVNVELPEDEWLNNAGTWTVTVSKHSLDVGSGYKTTITLKR